MKSMFQMEDVNAISAMNIHEAKKHVLSIVDGSTANKKNSFKSYQMIGRAKNICQLQICMTNYILAHPKEGLKTI